MGFLSRALVEQGWMGRDNQYTRITIAIELISIFVGALFFFLVVSEVDSKGTTGYKKTY